MEIYSQWNRTDISPPERLNDFPLTDLCTGDSQFSTEPTRGICRRTPFKSRT